MRHRPRSQRRRSAEWLLASLAALVVSSAAAQGAAPAIRTTPANRVPACVTPERLTAMLHERNPSPEVRFKDIARWYKMHGEAWRVRWDYAYFQMIHETNSLLFQRSPGVPGDVRPKQNNFAGLGTTGGGVPGDSYPDVSTGVLAQIQHLVAYSGERLAAPVGARTRLKQDDIVSKSLSLRRPVTFADLTNRWAADRNYWRAIESIAERYRAQYCRAEEARASAPEVASGPVMQRQVQTPASAAARAARAEPAGGDVAAATSARMAAGASVLTRSDAGRSNVQARGRCQLHAASYGGRKTVLISAPGSSGTHYHLVSVLDGFERSMTEGFIRERAPGGVAVGEFATLEAALAKARELCPSPS